MLDDVGRARQLAISQRTTVYMIFVPQVANWWNFLSASQLSAGTNLLDKQCRSYGFVTLRSVGDQPGQGVPRYLAEWKSLPDGAFIATNKFNHYYQYNPSVSYPNNDYLVTDSASSMNYPINSFNYYTNNNTLLPFPTETNFIYTSTFPYFTLPYIAFNYLGQLTVDGTTMALHDEFIPLAQGNVVYAMDAKKNLQPADADFTENPPGNSTNSMFNLVCIDRLTGRATLRQQKIQ